MKAWLTYSFGDMRLEDVPDPVDVPPDWALVRVLTVQPSITECLLFRGLPTYNLELVRRSISKGPARLFGHEYCAEVLAVGAGVDDLKPGMRVASRSVSSCGECWLCHMGRRDECQKGPLTGFHIPGCFAEMNLVPANSLVHLPDGISNSEGAALQSLLDAVAGVDAAKTKMGDVCLVIGQGVMGLGAMQAARVSGAGLVITSDIKESSLQLSRQLGADVVIDARLSDAVAITQRLTQGRGADIVIDAAGGPPALGLAGAKSLQQAAEAVRDGGVIVGLALHGEATTLPYEHFRHRSLRYVFPSALTRGLLAHTVGLVASGRIQLLPTITTVLDGIESVPEAFELTERKASDGLVNPAQVVIAT